MRFLADENISNMVVKALQAAAHDVLLVAQPMPGLLTTTF